MLKKASETQIMPSKLGLIRTRQNKNILKLNN